MMISLDQLTCKTLDHAFTNFPIGSTSLTSFPPLPKPDFIYHPSFVVSLDIKNKIMNEAVVKKHNFLNAGYDLINSDINEVDWNFLDTMPVDEGTSRFYSILNGIINSRFAFFKRKCDHPVWFSTTLINLLRQKRVLRRVYLRAKSQQFYLDFSAIRAFCKKEIIICYKEYLCRLQEDIPSNIRKFFRYTKK